MTTHQPKSAVSIRRCLLPALACLVAFVVGANVASAGMITGMGFEAIEVSSAPIEVSSMSVPASDPVRPATERDEPSPNLVAGLPGSPNSGAGSPGTAGGASGGISASAVADADEIDLPKSPLVAYLIRESRILLAVPFLDGIFRPPQARA